MDYTSSGPGQQALTARRAGYTRFGGALLAGAEVRVIGEVREVIAGGSVDAAGTEQKVRDPAAGQATCRRAGCQRQAAGGRPHLGASSSNGA